MNIFESLENLPISEKCFNDIMDMVEEYIQERDDENFEAAQDRRDRNKWKVYDKTSCVFYNCKGGKRGAQKEAKRLNTEIPGKPTIDPFYESFDLLEDIIDMIHKKYKWGAPEYGENGGVDLEDKIRAIQAQEQKEAQEREGVKPQDKRTKNLKGLIKHGSRQVAQWMKAESGKPVKSDPVKPYVFFDGNKKKVSEACFDEIMGMVEEYINENIYDAIDKKYGEGRNITLRKKAIDNAKKEYSAAFKRDADSSGSSDPEERMKSAMKINRAHKRLGNGNSIHLDQERKLNEPKLKPVEGEVGKAIVKGNDEFDKAHKEAVSASRLSRKADKKVKGAFDDGGYMTDKFNNPKDADKAWDTAQELAGKKHTAMQKLSDVNKKQKQN